MDRYIRTALASFAIAAILSAGTVAQAGTGFDGDWNLCMDEFVEVPRDLFRSRIPVGCELVDCCPGCPGMRDLLSWRILVEGAPLASASLRFDRLPKDIAAKLKFSGTAQGTAENALIGNGEAFISGLPVEIAGRAPVAQFEVNVDAAWIQAHAKETAKRGYRDAPDGAAFAGSFIVEQFLGNFLVNEYRVAYSFRRCGHAPADRISLENNASGDSASVLLDARRPEGCVTEESHRGIGIFGVGSVLANSGCRSEVVVFSDDDAMQLVENVGAWTDPLGDTLVVDMTPDRLMAPVTVWLARPGALSAAQADFDTANLLYNTNNSGIGFVPTFADIAGDPEALAAIGNRDDCGRAESLPGSAYFTANQLNVYYVDGAFTGVNCAPSANIQYVGTMAREATLAHEFGHSMSLDHTGGIRGIPDTNIMDPLGGRRTHFSDGQSFRMNAHCSSTLNVNAVRVGPVRRCDATIEGSITCPASVDTHCPPLRTDAVPK